jgi:hypothetical protein
MDEKISCFQGQQVPAAAFTPDPRRAIEKALLKPNCIPAFLGRFSGHIEKNNWYDWAGDMLVVQLWL